MLPAILRFWDDEAAWFYCVFKNSNKNKYIYIYSIVSQLCSGDENMFNHAGGMSNPADLEYSTAASVQPQ